MLFRSLDLSVLRADCEKTPTGAVGTGRSGLFPFPGLYRIVESVTVDGSYRAGVHTLATEFTADGPVEICINHRLHSSACKGKLSDTLNFVTDPNTSAAKNTFVGIPLEKRGSIIHGERNPVPGINRFLYAIFIDQGLKITIPLFFASGADHGVVEEDQLELKPS